MRPKAKLLDPLDDMVDLFGRRAPLHYDDHRLLLAVPCENEPVLGFGLSRPSRSRSIQKVPRSKPDQSVKDADANQKVSLRDHLRFIDIPQAKQADHDSRTDRQTAEQDDLLETLARKNEQNKEQCTEEQVDCESGDLENTPLMDDRG